MSTRMLPRQHGCVITCDYCESVKWHSALSTRRGNRVAIRRDGWDRMLVHLAGLRRVMDLCPGCLVKVTLAKQARISKRAAARALKNVVA